jgi:hypothetical protein
LTLRGLRLRGLTLQQGTLRRQVETVRISEAHGAIPRGCTGVT